MAKWFQSIGFKMAVLMVILAVVPLGAFGLFSLNRTEQYLRLETQKSFVKTAGNGINRLENSLKGAFEAVRLTAARPEFSSFNQDQMEFDLQLLLKEQPEIISASVLNGSGKEVIRTSLTEFYLPDDYRDLSADGLYAAAMAGRRYVGPVQFDDQGQPKVVLARPIQDPAKQQNIGAIMVEVSLINLLDRVMAAKIGRTGHLAVLNSEGRYIAHLDNSLVLSGAEFAQKKLLPRMLGQRGPDRLVGYTDRQKLPVLAIAQRSKDLGWLVLVEQDRKEALTSLNQARQVFGYGLSGGIILAGLIALMTIYWLLRPIKSLEQGAIAVGEGQLDLEIQVNTADELGRVGRAFNNMVSRLRESLNELNDKVEAETKAREELEQTAARERRSRQEVETLAAQAEEARQYLAGTIDEYLVFVESISQGDLTGSLVPPREDDPLGILGLNLKSMKDNLNRIIAGNKETINALTSLSAELLAAASQQAAVSGEQAAAVSQTGAITKEVRQTAELTADQALLVSEQADKSMESTGRGLDEIQNTLAEMKQIESRVLLIAESITALSEQTKQIGEIIATVNDIADQSNLLALNASIEAARAGETGKGFAVVAAEVRALAQRSRTATGQIKEILEDIQTAAENTVKVTEEGTKSVEHGVESTRNTSQTFESIAASNEQMAQAAKQILNATREEVAGIDQIVAAVDEINQAAIQTQAGSRQVEETAGGLNKLAESLTEGVSKYRL